MADKYLRCGSEKVIPEIPLLDHFGDLGVRSTPTQVQVQGQPGAWLFKDTVAGQLFVCDCWECGHAEMRVSNHRELFEKYRQARGR